MFSFKGLRVLKPFDETADNQRAGAIYADSVLFSMAIVAAAFLVLTALVMLIAGFKNSREVFVLAMAIYAVMAGFEWHAGLKAKALNNLFMVVLSLFMISIAG